MPVSITYPYAELHFDASGKPADAKQLQALAHLVRNNKVTDLFVISHGWNNDEKEAHALYQELFNNIKAQEANVDVGGRSFAVAGVIWPSKKFDAAEDSPKAAALGAGHARVAKQVDTLKALLADAGDGAKHGKELDRAKALIPTLETSADARREFSAIVLAHLPKTVGEEGGWYIDQKIAKPMVEDDRLLKQLGSPPPKVASKGSGGAASMPRKRAPVAATFQGAAGLGDLFKGVIAGASNLLNYVTYYQMKERAGKVGRAGVNEVLRTLRAQFPALRVHLVGHSFGCRVVTAAVTGQAAGDGALARSMSLLQGAFSHYAFSASFDATKKPGFFRNLVTEKRVSGPVIITYTRADKAVGLAYAVASRAAGQIAAAIGDKNDPFGGLGSNGAQQTTEAHDGKLPKAGSAFAQPLSAGSMTNLLADGLITSHGDVRNPNVAHAVLSAVCAE